MVQLSQIMVSFLYYLILSLFPGRMTTCEVVINVTDINDHTPEIEKSTYKVTIKEDVNVSTELLIIKAEDGDVGGETGTTGNNAEIVFSLIDVETDKESEFFSIHANTGVISTKQTFDRDSENAELQFTLTIIAKDQGSSPRQATSQLVVIVNDVNDNRPEWKLNADGEIPEYDKTYVENELDVGDEVLKVVAIDGDQKESDNALLTYTMTGDGGDYMEINNETGAVTLTAAYDFETVEQFTLLISVADNGSPQLDVVQPLKVIVTVTDFNDNKPVFVKIKLGMISLLEGTKKGQPLGTVQATDEDSEENGNVTFSLTSDESFPFAIDEDTGVITLTGALDFEDEEHYTVTVEAADGGDPQLKSADEAVLKVTVLNVNEATPVFEKDDYFCEFEEDADKDSECVTVKATDDDRDDVITYSIVGGGGSSLFSIDNETGAVTLTDGLDFEDSVQHALVVEAKDGGDPLRKATVVVIINVTDINDNDPVFDSNGGYGGTLAEDAAKGAAIATLGATDKDSDEITTLAFSISEFNGYEDVFDIDGDKIILKDAVLDYEDKKQYKIEVTVVDSDEGRSATADVTLTVTDVNDNDPEWDENVTPESFVSEEIEVGSQVFALVATDEDQDGLAPVTYHLSTASLEFAVSKKTGVVTTTTAFDYEDVNQYQIKVIAKDEDAKQTAVLTITIHIRDANDLDPVF